MIVEFMIIIMVRILQLMLMVLFASFRLAWKLIKWELHIVKTCFLNYPIGLFSFFIHFFGFWIAMYQGDIHGRRFLVRLYTLGLCDSVNGYLKIFTKPIEFVFTPPELSNSNSWSGEIAVIIFSFLMIWCMWVVLLVFLETVLFLFPIIYACLTQLTIGIIFKSKIGEWKYKRSATNQRCVNVTQSSNETRREYSNERNLSLSNSIKQEEDELCSIEIKGKEERTPIREFDQTYCNVIERISKRTLKIHQVYVKLIEVKGKNLRVEKLYNEVVEVNNDLQVMYYEAQNTICFSADIPDVKQIYDDLKKQTFFLKNVQEDLISEIKKVYGVQVG